jgi:hypothetical protein
MLNEDEITLLVRREVAEQLRAAGIRQAPPLRPAMSDRIVMQQLTSDVAAGQCDRACRSVADGGLFLTPRMIGDALARRLAAPPTAIVMGAHFPAADWATLIDEERENEARTREGGRASRLQQEKATRARECAPSKGSAT